MKCPKCGFNSFEYYDICKKCASDLSGYKQTYSISPTVLPLEAKQALADKFRSAVSASDQISNVTETHDDIFSFDLPGEQQNATAHLNEDPFSFDETPSVHEQPVIPKIEDDAFADLLELTSQSELSPFAAEQTNVVAAPAKAVETSSGPGEFDLESFSWDDTPAESTSSTGSETADDFDSLFGDTKENTHK